MNFDLGTFKLNNEENRSVTSCSELEERIWSDKEQANWSDWKIIISCDKTKSLEDGESCSSEEEKKVETLSCYEDKVTYYVHRSQLASGKRKSEYFKTLFEQDKIIESINSTSTITFEHESSLLAFPIMLDYLYSSSKDYIQFTTETATALRYLSNYFLIQDLFEDVNAFIQSDMKINNNVETYLSESYEYKDEKLLTAASKFINEKYSVNDIERILSIPTDVLMSGRVSNMVLKLAEHFELVEIELVLGMPYELLKLILSCSTFAYDSDRLSVTMYEYIKEHGIEDKEVIHTLTSSDIMPSIDPDYALSILDYIEGLSQGRSNLLFKSLFNRCIESISQNWNILIQPDQCSKDCCTEEDQKYKNISPTLMNNLLLQGLQTAKKNYDELVVSSQKKYDNLVELFQLLLVAAQKETDLKH